MRVAGGAEGGAEEAAASVAFHAMAAVRAGDLLPLTSSPAAEARWTQPPAHLSEAELLGLMEEHGVVSPQPAARSPLYSSRAA